jgi:hypothetical protein
MLPPQRKDHNASPDNDVVPPPHVPDPMMVMLGLLAPIPSGRGDIGGIGGGADGALIALGLDPRALDELVALQAHLRITVIFALMAAESAVESTVTGSGV